MYEFIYEGFDFLQKFQVEIPSKIFVIENPEDFEFYYVERGVMFTAHMTKDEIWVKMVEKYGEMEKDAAISLFKQTQFKDVTEPLGVKKDIVEPECPEGPEEIVQPELQDNPKSVVINISLAEKLKDMKFTMV